MDIISEPGFTTETVTDLDVAFLNGIRSLTLHPEKGDLLDVQRNDVLVVTFVTPPETVRLFVHQILWYSVRDRIVKTPVKVKRDPT